jgi:hypothetical protein
MTAAVDDGVCVCVSLSLALNVREVMYYAHVQSGSGPNVYQRVVGGQSRVNDE